MPSRSQMDAPAMVVVTVLGVVLIAVSAPFLDAVESSGTDYRITWTEAEAGSAQAATGGAGSTTTIRVPVTDSLPSNATIEVESCTDAATPPLSQPATITWTLFRGSEEVQGGRGTASCANDGPFRVALDSSPDVGLVTASSPRAAERQAYAAGDNETVEFRLEFSYARPAGPGGLPLPQPAFTATVSLTLHEWTATANEADQEGPR